MSLPLRDAREVFEREYLKAQVDRFGAAGGGAGRCDGAATGAALQRDFGLQRGAAA